MIRKTITNIKLQSNTNNSWEKNKGMGILPDSHESDLSKLCQVNTY